MKIAFLSRFQNITERGAENFVSELSKRLSKHMSVDILSGKDADDFSKVIKGGYDVVIPINGRLQSLKASLGRISGKYKMLISGHSGIGRDDIWNIAICKPDVFVALTDYMYQWAKNWAWGSKVVKISNGVDLNKFSPNGAKINIDLPKPIILSVGALVWYKYHDRLIKAASQMGEASVLIVGKGPEEANLINRGKKLLGNRFKIAQFKYEDMPKVYRSCDLFSLPSWDREAFGMVYLEALASGLGVIAPSDASRREIVGEGGLFVDANDPISFAKAIEQGLKMDWVAKARTQAEKFSWDKVVSEYEKVMLNMIKK
ncbi:MAG: glycosyltransferase family 4 protein [Actinobacteria bacterium]|nr:glycosyltransferase family 4 protein [Actinomycetota bacterium]